MKSKSRILIVDALMLIGQALHGLLVTQGLVVVGEAENGFDAVEKVAELHPDLVLIDLHLPRLSGIEATRIIRREFPDVEVVICMDSENAEDMIAAAEAGAHGYVLKSGDQSALLTQIKQVLSGGIGMQSEIITKLIKGLAEGSTRRRRGISTHNELTQREREVLSHLAAGETNARIGRELNITTNTVRAHVYALRSKLNLANRTQLAVYALRQGLGL